jgi:hypothetical protein
MRLAVVLICLCLLIVASKAEASNARSNPVTHIMLFSLKHPGNINDQNFLLCGLRTMRRVRGVNGVHIGRSLGIRRSGVDQSFDLDALEKFERDPRRRAALDALLQPIVRRYIVYDFANE